MTFVRALARGLIAYGIGSLSYGAFRDPEPRAKTAGWLAEPMGRAVSGAVPGFPTDPVSVVKVNAGVQMGCAGLLALGKFPRLSATALAGSMIATTIGGHAFWRAEEPQVRAQQLAQFRKNAGLIGGLIFVALDRGGKPSLAWKAKYGRERARRYVAEKR